MKGGINVSEITWKTELIDLGLKEFLLPGFEEGLPNSTYWELRTINYIIVWNPNNFHVTVYDYINDIGYSMLSNVWGLRQLMSYLDNLYERINNE